jgi:predicted anti-sigma-YlaC factor YlaD
MKKSCARIRQWLEQSRGGPTGQQAPAEIEMHLKTCASCREFASYRGFLSALRLSGEQQAPEPSEQFVYNLKRRLARCPGSSQKPLTDNLVHMGWKLIPAMAVVTVMALASLSMGYRAPVAASQQSDLEDVVLFEEEALTDNTILGAIVIEENINGK